MLSKRAIGKVAGAIALGATTGAGIVAARKTTKRIQNEARVEGRHVPYGSYEALLKRPLDVVLSAGALVVLSPVMAATAVAVRVKLGSPVIFKQVRPGLNGEPFEIYKFRSMIEIRGWESGQLVSDEGRLTNFGRTLRTSSLDELPEFYNVLKGDMSLIGPRPLLMSYLPYYTDEEQRRHDVRPGITGLAQVSGRNTLSWAEKFGYDVQYVQSVRFATDIRIFLETLTKIYKHSDVLMGRQLPVGRLDEERAAQ